MHCFSICTVTCILLHEGSVLNKVAVYATFKLRVCYARTFRDGEHQAASRIDIPIAAPDESSRLRRQISCARRARRHSLQVDFKRSWTDLQTMTALAARPAPDHQVNQGPRGQGLGA